MKTKETEIILELMSCLQRLLVWSSINEKAKDVNITYDEIFLAISKAKEFKDNEKEIKAAQGKEDLS